MPFTSIADCISHICHHCLSFWEIDLGHQVTKYGKFMRFFPVYYYYYGFLGHKTEKTYLPNYWVFACNQEVLFSHITALASRRCFSHRPSVKGNNEQQINPVRTSHAKVYIDHLKCWRCSPSCHGLRAIQSHASRAERRNRKPFTSAMLDSSSIYFSSRT